LLTGVYTSLRRLFAPKPPFWVISRYGDVTRVVPDLLRN